MEKVKPYIHWTTVGYTRALVVGPVAIPGVALVVGTVILLVAVMAGGYLFGPTVGDIVIVAVSVLVLLVLFGILVKLVLSMIIEDFRKVNGKEKK